MSKSQVRIGLLGLGTVASALVDLIDQQHLVIKERSGVDLIVTKIAVRDLNRQRAVEVPDGMLTDDPMSVVESDHVDVVVELMGGIDPARSLIIRALELGKPVVTGNKELVATHGEELFAAAGAGNAALLFEAAVAGGIPLMRALEQSLRGEPLRRVMGIVNGTTNYILTQMAEHGRSYEDALAEAQALGYAEADPTADVEGFDAAAKAAIIATVSMGGIVTLDDVTDFGVTEGISSISAEDIAASARMGYVIKLLAIIDRIDGAEGAQVAVRVHPAMVPLHHPLAAVRDSFNAVFIEGDAVGDLMLYGRGAGGAPTASAVLGDVISAALGTISGTTVGRPPLTRADIRPMNELASAFYLEVEVLDRPGVLAEVAGVFGAHGVSIESMQQHGIGDEARLTFITHEARESDMDATVEKLAGLESVRRIGSKLRVISA